MKLKSVSYQVTDYSKLTDTQLYREIETVCARLQRIDPVFRSYDNVKYLRDHVLDMDQLFLEMQRRHGDISHLLRVVNGQRDFKQN